MERRDNDDGACRELCEREVIERKENLKIKVMNGCYFSFQ